MEGDIRVNGLKVVHLFADFRRNGEYKLTFGHDTTLAQLEAIDWAQPEIEIVGQKKAGKQYLPEGYGFELQEISYSSRPKQWEVRIKTAVQYYGDVTGYQAQIAELQEDSAAKDAQIAQLQEDGTAAAETELQEAYKEGVDSVG